VTASSLTWLGQASFRIDLDGLRVLIDPYFGEHPSRLYPPGNAETAARDLDVILVTHEHIDHYDPAFLQRAARLSPGVRVVLPTPLLDDAQRLGLNAVGVQPGDELALLSSVSLTVTPAWHGTTPADAYTEGRGADGIARFVGYIVRSENIAIYHAGDTIVTEGLLAALRGQRIDVALLPVNGRDAEREAAGIVGNMNAREAVELADQIGATTLVPMHWDLFEGNTSAPEEASAIAGELRLQAQDVIVPQRDAQTQL
jgi:L-ascorbate metabolism protein UlaG (beta-lactamase superfamily)